MIFKYSSFLIHLDNIYYNLHYMLYGIIINLIYIKNKMNKFLLKKKKKKTK